MSANAKLIINTHAAQLLSSLANLPPMNHVNYIAVKHNYVPPNKTKVNANQIPKPKINTVKNQPVVNGKAPTIPFKGNIAAKGPNRKNNFIKSNMMHKPLTCRERSRSLHSGKRKDLKSTPQQSSVESGSEEMKALESTKDKTTINNHHNNNQCFNLDKPIGEINTWNINTNNTFTNTISNPNVISTTEQDFPMDQGINMNNSLYSTMEFTNKHLNEIKGHYTIFNDNTVKNLLDSTNMNRDYKSNISSKLITNHSIPNPMQGLSMELQNPLSTSTHFLQNNINKIDLGVFNQNYEELNHKINSKSVNFSTEEYRRLLDTFSMLEYGNSILSDFFDNEIKISSCLEKHGINPKMRTKMIDWMIEVFSTFKSNDTTFFIAVMIMDRFFSSAEQRYTPSDLHLIGITCIFIASKFSDVYPIKLKLIVERVSHNKYNPSDITQMEDKIFKCLNYDILLPTTLDFLNYYFKYLFFYFENNFNIKDKRLCDYLISFVEKLNISIKLDTFYYDKCANIKKYTENMMSFLYCIIIYLAKMCCHDYSISAEKPSLIAASVLLVGMRICEEVNSDNYVNELFLEKLSQVSRQNQYTLLNLSKKILWNAQNFDKVFVGMENLKKKHFDSLALIPVTK